MSDYNQQIFAEKMGIQLPTAKPGAEDLATPIPSLNELRNGLIQHQEMKKMLNPPPSQTETHAQQNIAEDNPLENTEPSDPLYQLKVDQMVDLLKKTYGAQLTMNIPPQDLEPQVEYMMHLKPSELVKRFETIFNEAGERIARQAANQPEYIDLYRNQLKLPDTDETKNMLTHAFPVFYKDAIMTRVIALAGEKAKSGLEEFTREEIGSLVNLNPSEKVTPGKMSLTQIKTWTTNPPSTPDNNDDEEPLSPIGNI